MTAGNGRPCKRCGTSDWHKDGGCRECRRKYNRHWRENNPERVREYRNKWQRNNPEKQLESSRNWRRNNPEKERESSRNWERNNPEKLAAASARRRTRKTEAGGSYTAAEFKALVKHQGGRCLACGQKKKLTADHVIPVVAGGSSDISNIQGLCRPCNSSKGARTIDYRKEGGFFRWIQRKLFD